MTHPVGAAGSGKWKQVALGLGYGQGPTVFAVGDGKAHAGVVVERGPLLRRVGKWRSREIVRMVVLSSPCLCVACICIS